MTTYVLPYIPVGHVGAQRPYPFKKLLPGDTLKISIGRSTRHALYCSILRFQKQNPGTQFTIREDHPFRFVTRTA